MLQVVLLDPPADSPVGEALQVEGVVFRSVEPGNRASKAFAKVADDLQVGTDRVAAYKGAQRLLTSKGPVTAEISGRIS